ncbi:MAG: EF-P beta-lysylation protein EpmB [Thermoguttaceae bacterium]
MADCRSETKRGTGPDDWQSILAQAVRNPSELCEILGIPRLLPADAEAAMRWPMLVPRTYVARIRPGDPADPLLRQVLPQAAELTPVDGFSTDPLDEAASLGQGPLLRKYLGRALIVTTPSCGARCRFCFRRHSIAEPSPATADWRSALQAIATDPSIREVILSGGDPLTLPDSELADLTNQLTLIPHVDRLRIHTRLPILIPQRVTDGLIQALRLNDDRRRLATIVVVHVNHPAEIDPQTANSLGRLIDAGIPVLSQTVLLRGVNDRADVLTQMYERLINLRVIPYYLHQLDAVAGAAHFEVPTAKARQLLGELRARLPGYAVPRYVREIPGENSKHPLD